MHIPLHNIAQLLNKLQLARKRIYVSGQIKCKNNINVKHKYTPLE